MTDHLHEEIVRLFEELKEIAFRKVTALGFPLDPSANGHALLAKYLNWKLRRVSERPRTPRRSQELQAAWANLPPDQQAGIERIEALARAGGDLNPNLSKGTEQDKFDQLMNDWGIHHFHLGTALEVGTNFIERTGPLLFAVIKADEVFLIGVFKHGSWAKKDLIEILNRNWPALTGGSKLKGVLGLETSYTEDEVKKLRAAGVNVVSQLSDGAIIAGLGGGIATDGSNIGITVALDRMHQELRYAIERCHDDPNFVLSFMAAEMGRPVAEFRLVIVETPEGFALVDEKTGVEFFAYTIW